MPSNRRMRSVLFLLPVPSLVHAGCGDFVSVEDSTATRFVDELSVSVDNPIKIGCVADDSAPMSAFARGYGDKEDLMREYPEILSHLDQKRPYQGESGLAFQAQHAVSCPVTHDGRVLDQWPKGELP